MPDASPEPAVDLSRLAPSLGSTCEEYLTRYRTAFAEAVRRGDSGVSTARALSNSLDGLLGALFCASDAATRAAGLPAREVAGLVYVEGVHPGFYFHQWAKVWVGKWIDVDPTFNQPLVDVTHIKLAEGDLFQQARIIPIIGQLKIQEAAAQ